MTLEVAPLSLGAGLLAWMYMRLIYYALAYAWVFVRAVTEQQVTAAAAAAGDGGDGGKPPLALAAAALQAPFTASVCVGAVCLAAAVGLQLWLDASLGDRPRKWPGTTRGARAVPQGRGDTATALL